MTHVRPSILTDCCYIADNIRDADRNELDLWNVTPRKALVTGFEESLQPLTIISNSMPCAMFGVTEQPTNPGFGVIWLLGTNDLFTARVPFLRQSVIWLHHACKPFSSVGNWVDSRNTRHLRWLRWLGFEVIDKSIVKNVPVHFHHLKVNK